MAVNFEDVKLGKHPAIYDPRTLMLRSFLAPDLGPPPAYVSRTRKVRNWGMLKNDVVGDCSIAALLHTIQSWRLSLPNAPELLEIPDEVAIEYYGKWCGYDPSKPASDRGGNELSNLKLWRKSTISIDGTGHNLKAWADPDPGNIHHIKWSIAIFGSVYIGLALPLSAQRQRTWDVECGYEGVPGSWGLHAVNIDNYDQEVVVCTTWGAQQVMTWQFFHACCDEAHTLMSDTDFESSMFDYDALLQHLQAVTG